jgi:hypothetical protein
MANTPVRNFVSANRAYLNDKTRDRSIGKGYGFGRLSTNNHFDSPYINSDLKGFNDDFYFTPAVYEYLNRAATPSVEYDTGKPLYAPNSYVDFDGVNKIRLTANQPTAITKAHVGPYEPWQDAPSLNLSTHRSWNWGKPGYCWDELDKLGFGPDLIGTRPAGE